MLNKIRNLLTQPSVREAVEGAGSRGDAARIIVEAGSKQGHSLSVGSVFQALGELTAPRSRSLSERELLLVSGGMMADSAPKLCHTESCGGHAGQCCPP